MSEAQSATDPYLELLEQHLIASLLKQARLEQHIVGAAEWTLDLDEGFLALGDLRLPADLVGLESPDAHVFHWAWAIPDVPPERIRSADTIRAIGERRGIAPLTAPSVSLDGLTAQLAGIAASGLTNADAFWIGDLEQGSVLLLVRDEELRARPWPLEALPRILGGIAESGLPVDHGRTLRAFTERPPHRFAATTSPEGVVTVTAPAGSVDVVFDDQGRWHEVRLEEAGA